MTYSMKNLSAHHSRRGHEYGVHHFLSQKPGTLKSLLPELIALPEEQVEKLIHLGSVYLNHSRCFDLHKSIHQGDYLRVHSRPRRYPVDRIDYQKIIVFENTDFVVLNKPAGIPVHATVDNCQENLIYQLSKKMNVNFKVTHRLDVATSGLMVLAKTDKFQKEFNQLLTESKVKKIYRAYVNGKNAFSEKTGSDSLIHYMEPSPRAPKKVNVHPLENWQRCALKILSSKQINLNTTELLIELETGRTHQIRAQLSYEGFPVMGDNMYGCNLETNKPYEWIALQSYNLSFPEKFEFTLDEVF